jgi:hypothetical protein
MNNWFCWLPKCRCNHMLKIHDTIVVMVSWNWIGTSCCSKRVDQCFAGCALELLWGLFDSEKDLVPQISWVLCSRRETEDCPWNRRSMYLAEFFASILVSSKHLLLGWSVDGFDTIESMNELTNKWAIKLSLHITAFRSLIFLIQKYWKQQWNHSSRIEMNFYL